MGISNTSDANVVSGSLTFSSGTHALTTSANEVTLGNASASTTLATTVGPTGSVTDLWLSYEFNMTLSSAYASGYRVGQLRKRSPHPGRNRWI